MAALAIAFGLGVGQSSDPPGLIEATEFRLVDAEGRVRGDWILRDGTAPFLRMMAEDGSPWVTLGGASFFGSQLSLSDVDGGQRISLGTLPGGLGSGLRLWADQEQVRAGLLIDDENKCYLSLEGQDGEAQVQLGSVNDGNGGFIIVSRDGNEVVTITSSERGAGVVLTKDGGVATDVLGGD